MSDPAAQLSRLYNRLAKAHARDRTIQLSAEDVDWFIVSGAYAKLLEAVGREAESRSASRLKAKGYDLSSELAGHTSHVIPAAADNPEANKHVTAAEPAASPDMPDVFSVAALAAFWGCSTGRVYSLIHGGELQSFKLGSLHRIKRDAVLAYQGAQRPVARHAGGALKHSEAEVQQALQRAQEMVRPTTRSFARRKPR